MNPKHFLAAAAALSMAAAPAFSAPANPAASLSLAHSDVRASAPMKGASKARASTIVLAGAAVAGVVIAAVLLSHHDSKAASN
jgi:hypothetical protein